MKPRKPSVRLVVSCLRFEPGKIEALRLGPVYLVYILDESTQFRDKPNFVV
jgi:hypothetical protein